MTTILGIDAGGTRTTALVANGSEVVARATGGAGAVRPGRALQAAAKITAAARQALTEAGLLQADLLVVGAAGVGREPERTELREGLRSERLANRIVVTGDLDIALEAAFGEKPGIVLVSGTGSVAVGRVADHTIHRRGGFGWQIGDEGSGFAIGRAALMAIAKAHDGRGANTELTPSMLAASPARDFDALVRWSGNANPAEIAALAPLVFQVAGRGDEVAQGIVDAAAEELVALVGSLIPLYGQAKTIPLALTGGNLEPGRGLREPVVSRLRRTSRIRVREDSLRPAEGALALGRRLGAS